MDRFPDLSRWRVLDLGGTPESWERVPCRPVDLILLNTNPKPSGTLGRGVTYIEGDACDPPPPVSDERFDLVYSNSVIEHVGGHRAREHFAEVVHCLGRHHWIQTPYRYFPLEPHWTFPGMQFAPVSARATISARWPLSWSREGTRRDHIGLVLDVDLLSETSLRYYFPRSEILRERIAGLTKSLIATA
jgi:hypothetical protein